jgi:antitoxin YefM
MEDNEALDETTYLLRSPENARRLLESIEEVEKASQTKKSWSSQR